MNRTSKHAATVIAFVGFAGIAAAGCLDRPVVYREPSLNTTFTTSIAEQHIDQVDILVVIDNSASMGDKQEYLSQAVPGLITRLVTPNCVDPTTGTVYGTSDAQGNGTCTQGKVEFPPVHDMHVGVLSTSLGTRLSDQYKGGSGIICDPKATLTVNGATISNHNDDRGELLNRAGPTETPLADTGTSFYLNWFPNTAMNSGKSPSSGAPAITDATQLIQDFTGLIQGVGNYGCGIESQLESWYRFLVQPDPYDSLTLDANGHAQWSGVDATILKERHDFLRPGSLVAIIDMTDENDSEIDVRALGGQGYLWMAQNFDPPRGTSACDENAAGSGLVNASSCNSCQLASGAGSDPSCALGAYSAQNDWGFNANLRHVHMIQKYGLSQLQFPIQRYVLGLTSPTVPDRNSEYPAGSSSYEGLTNRDCTNPLFAASLPDGSSTDPTTLCKLPAGTRTPDLIYYAHIGGVPHQLLQEDPSQPDSKQKPTLTDADWTKILGNDPLNQDYTGIDPHMIESYQPRPGMPTAGTSTDPASGYDWITDSGAQHVLAVDREYACTFTLPTPRDCSNTSDPSVTFACDCPASTGLTPQQLPPICNPSTPTQQVGAKAYPTQRELLLAKLMKGQGIVSSLCPIHVQPAAGLTALTDPLYGYNQAVAVIVARLKTSLQGACVPEKLVPYVGDAGLAGAAPCLVLVSLPVPANAPGETCANPGAACNVPGLFGPGFVPPGYASSPLPQAVLDRFCATQEASYTGKPGAPGDPNLRPVCAMTQLILDPNDTTECKGSSTAGWCYVQAQNAQQAAQIGCPYTIEFSPTMPPSGATTNLQCLETSVNLAGATTP